MLKKCVNYFIDNYKKKNIVLVSILFGLIGIIFWSIFYFGAENIIEEIGEKYFPSSTDIDPTPSSIEPVVQSLGTKIL